MSTQREHRECAEDMIALSVDRLELAEEAYQNADMVATDFQLARSMVLAQVSQAHATLAAIADVGEAEPAVAHL